MKKQSLFLIFVIVLTSCTSLTKTPSPSSDPSGAPTQAPVSEVETPWQTYTNAEAGFSIQYPADWQEQDMPDANDGQRQHIALQGPEGAVELVWGIGLGGACPEGYQPISIAQGTWPACHSQKEDGTDFWSLAAQPIGDIGFAGFIYTNDTTPRSKEIVLQVISTLSFP